MKVMGIEVAGSDTIWAILVGTKSGGTIEMTTPAKLPLPVSGSGEIENLIALRGQIQDLLISRHVDAVGVVRADHSSSVVRAKIECMIQLAAKEANIPCYLVSVQTVIAAQKRKVVQVTGTSFEQAFGKIQPGYVNRALHCAWSVLNGDF